jgi:hypothetical protein
MAVLTYLVNGNLNVGTRAGAVTAIRMCNPHDLESVREVREQARALPRKLLFIPLTGDDRTLFGNALPEPGAESEAISLYGSGALGMIGRVEEIFAPFRPSGRPMWTRIIRPGGAFLVCEIPESFLADEDLALLRLQGILFLAMAVVRGQSRPITARGPEGNALSSDEIAVMWHAHTKAATGAGEWLNTYDVLALSHAALTLGLTLEAKCTLQLVNNVDGDLWKAMHSTLKQIAVGPLGVPCVPAVVDTTDGMLTHPTLRALLSVFTLAAQAHGWDPIRLGRCALTCEFIDYSLYEVFCEAV